MLTNNEILKSFRVVIASLPDKENCVCEIHYNNAQWVEISTETDTPIIYFYSHPVNDYWEFPLDVALEVLEKAKKRYLEE
ncbi:hypothetical protein [Candidatus Protochlamydia naegleriophila]|nr:hypothetical protein [Candidatus Protochlamydia naegleriophila]